MEVVKDITIGPDSEFKPGADTSYKAPDNPVDPEMFKQIKNLVVQYAKAQKSQRQTRRALMKKFQQISKNQWKNTFPILFMTVNVRNKTVNSIVARRTWEQRATPEQLAIRNSIEQEAKERKIPAKDIVAERLAAKTLDPNWAELPLKDDHEKKD